MIQITYQEKKYDVEEGMRAADFIRNVLQKEMEGIMACKISNEVK